MIYGHPALSIAILAAELPPEAPESFRLLPVGLFRASDGRPEGLPGWRLTPEDMARLVAEAEARETDYPIDYEHQIIEAKKNGQPAPAAGWFRRLEAREDGLWAVDVRWTERARRMIAAGEYRYISPVFTYRKDGTVERLLMAAITNFPALDGLTDLSPLSFYMEDSPMSESLAALKAALGAPDDADVAKLAADTIQTLTAEVASLKAERDALKAAAAESVPMSQLAALQAEVASLKAEAESRERAALLEQGLADGRILPAQRDYWAAQPLAALKQWLSVAQPIAALTATQSGGKSPETKTASLTDEQRHLCRIAGWSEDVFRGAA